MAVPSLVISQQVVYHEYRLRLYSYW